MLGKTNVVLMSGGGSSAQTYGVNLAYEYLQNLRNGSANDADSILLDVLAKTGNSSKLTGIWTYKPASYAEYLQDVLTGDNAVVCSVLRKFLA